MSIIQEELRNDSDGTIRSASLKKVCPRCAHALPAEGADTPVGCPTCGALIPALEVSPLEAAGFNDEERLISDLRAAFESSEESGGAKSSAVGSGPLLETPSPSMFNDSAGPGSSVHIGEFEILNEIGRGGMGVVYRARQPSLGREVALKVLPGGGRRARSAVRRFNTEARAVARLNHPNVVPLYSQGEHDNQFYYAMALIDGCSLDVAIQSRPELLSSTTIRRSIGESRATPSNVIGTTARSREITVAPADDEIRTPFRTDEDFRHLARLVAAVADGLAHAHAHGVIHRDIKPRNLLLSGDGRIYITDFGLSHLQDESHMTLTGEVMGTPAYLSPEQIQGDAKTVDHRTDIYSLGVTLYELLTARQPFSGDTREQVLSRICSLEAVPPRRWDRRIPIDLETICLRAIDKDPARRYDTAASMADDLRRFAEGRPILSYRPGPASRAVRYVRRHKAATLVVASLAVATAGMVGFAAKATSSRITEADRLLQGAYEQLVYSDYRSPQLVLDAIAQAEALGADPTRMNLVRALASLGFSDSADAIQGLGMVLDDEPGHVTAHYLLAWAQWRERDVTGSRATFDRVEALGGPRFADEWFFRGLATHFDRPEIAITSYEQANAARAAGHQFFPQAALHLARAYNQQMYARRTVEFYDDAQAILSQLIKLQHYGAYPHYLLSITQRLGGEILESDPDSPQPDQAADHYRAALDTARSGQATDRDDDRPIAAEAESLERLGQYQEAIEARTRAIASADQEPARCEGYHYRWRLKYWVDDFNGALQDIESHATCVPDSLWYSRIYPAWVYADAGDMERAIFEARSIAEEAPNDVQAVVWSAACLRILGRGDEAQALLTSRAEQVNFADGLVPPQTEQWMRHLYDLSLGQRGLDDLLLEADEVDEPRKLRAEAYFHAAVRELPNGRRDEAERLLLEAHRSFDSELRYTFHARALLVKLQGDPNWPDWIPVQETAEWNPPNSNRKMNRKGS